MSEYFIKAPVQDKSGNQLEPVRIPLSEVKEYRKWLNKEGDAPQTVFIFKKGAGVTKAIVDMDVEDVDELLSIERHG